MAHAGLLRLRFLDIRKVYDSADHLTGPERMIFCWLNDHRPPMRRGNGSTSASTDAHNKPGATGIEG